MIGFWLIKNNKNKKMNTDNLSKLLYLTHYFELSLIGEN